MADGKSKSDICSDVVDDDTFDDDCRTIGDDDAVQNLQFCTPVAAINASTVEADMAMAAKKWLIDNFMVLSGRILMVACYGGGEAATLQAMRKRI